VTSRAGRAGQVTWAALALLLLQQGAELWAHRSPWVIWLGTLLPLLIFVPGMLRGNLRSYIWLCFVILLYFMDLVVELFAWPGDLFVCTGLVAVVVLFTGATLHVRWRARELRAAGGERTVQDQTQ